MKNLVNKRIIYPQSNGVIAVITPADCGLSLNDIIAKDVPINSPYMVVDIEVIPTDRSQRQAWVADFSQSEINTGV